VVGPVIGFLVEQGDQPPLWISGDTVYFAGLEEVVRRAPNGVGIALLHMGGVRFGISGPLRYTMNGEEAARAASLVGAATVVPIHYDGWEHFREPRAEAERAFERAGLAGRVRWLRKGERTEIT
jgi:L-ascorbate metabolism protein UlaG (beta-lactamase superfamily)